MFSDPQGILCTETEALRHSFEQFDSVDTDWSLFLSPLLLYISDNRRLDGLHAIMYSLNNLLIVDFATEPFQSCHLT